MSGAKLPVEDLSRDELIKLVRMQADAIKRLEKQVEELFAKLKEKNPTERLDQPYSQKAEEQRKKSNKDSNKGRKNKLSRRRKGRVSTAEKIKQAERTERVYPDDIEPTDCTFSHTRVAWRLQDGKAILVAYEIYRHRNHFGRIEGVLGRSEFGIEIVLALSYQVHCLGLSIDKDGATLAAVLDKEHFDGTLVSDDAAVYQGFNEAQKCWAHLIRKAIKLTLTSPDDPRFRRLADGLLSIYRDAKRLANDGRMLAATKQSKVPELDDRVLELCGDRWVDENRDGEGDEDDYRKLCNELMRLMLAEELFVFVYREGVEGNNNASERELREDATARRTGRTSKTPNGAKRRSIITSVLRSIGKQIPEFTLAGVIAEVKQWMIRGKSCFRDLASTSSRQTEPGILDRLILKADEEALAAPG